MKIYLLQELNYINGYSYWFNITKTTDKRVAKKMKKEFKEKFKNSIFQVVEVIC